MFRQLSGSLKKHEHIFLSVRQLPNVETVTSESGGDKERESAEEPKLVASENVSCATLTVIFSGSAFVTADLGIFSKKDNVCVLGGISSITVEPGPAS